MKKLVLLLVLCSFSGFAAESQRIGVVDMQKALRSVSAGKKAKETLEKEFSVKEAEFKKKEKALVELKNDLEKKAMALSEEQKQKKAMEFNQKMMGFREEVQLSQKQIADKERNMTLPIIEGLRKEIDALAKEKKFDLILEKNEQSVMFVSNEFELTDDLIKNFEKNWKSKK